MKLFFACWMLLAAQVSPRAQTISLTLDSCYILATNNYPMVKKYALLDRSREYNLDNISKGFLPRIQLGGQASYQSDVTQFPKTIPGVPELTKDQYKIYADLDQPLYDGGVMARQKKLQEAQSMADQQDLKVELYQLRDRVNQLFFSILLLDGQLKQDSLLKNDMQEGLQKIQAQIENGAALRSNADLLKAELLKEDQQTLELSSNREAFLEMLGLLIHRSLDENTLLIKPEPIIPNDKARRPELDRIDSRDKIFDVRSQLLTAQNHPKISLFLQGGFGKPAFNILSNQFDPFYIGGIRFSFPITGYYTLKNEKALLDIGKKNNQVLKETFLFNNSLELRKQNQVITKLQQFLKTDDEIIHLRSDLLKTDMARLDNGVINSDDFIRVANAKNGAVLSKIGHAILLLMAEYKAQYILGDENHK